MRTFVINELRNRTNAPAPSMAPYDFITGIQDQSSILKVASSKDFKDSLKELMEGYVPGGTVLPEDSE